MCIKYKHFKQFDSAFNLKEFLEACAKVLKKTKSKRFAWIRTMKNNAIEPNRINQLHTLFAKGKIMVLPWLVTIKLDF